jgi:hypothetical protein
VNNKLTKIINLFGGPGSGKSTTASGLFYHLKQQNVSCEIVTEYAKDLTYEDATSLLWNQLHVFSEQFRRQYRLIDKVDYIITDSPILLSSVYFQLYLEKTGKHFSPFYKKMSVDFFDTTFLEFDNINWFIERNTVFDTNGRLNTEEESVMIDKLIVNKLINKNIKFNKTNSLNAVEDIISRFDNNKYLTNQ